MQDSNQDQESRANSDWYVPRELTVEINPVRFKKKRFEVRAQQSCGTQKPTRLMTLSEVISGCYLSDYLRPTYFESRAWGALRPIGFEPFTLSRDRRQPTQRDAASILLGFSLNRIDNKQSKIFSNIIISCKYNRLFDRLRNKKLYIDSWKFDVGKNYLTHQQKLSLRREIQHQKWHINVSMNRNFWDKSIDINNMSNSKHWYVRKTLVFWIIFKIKVVTWIQLC